MHGLTKDETGNVYGELTVLGFCGRDGGGKLLWECKCSCGKITRTRGTSLRAGHSRSCGCLNVQASVSANTTHGMWGAKIYYIWYGMMGRCYNQNHSSYKHYGARGIDVCKEWHTFEKFLEDMGEKPEGLTLERVDNDSGYCADNCIWETPRKQMWNTRRNVVLEFEGKSACIAEWADSLGMPYAKLYSRIKNGWTAERALTTP